MNKQELIHIHGLLSEVRRWYMDRGRDVPCERYNGHGVGPTTIPAPKSDHERAIRLLASALVNAIESERTEPIAIESP